MRIDIPTYEIYMVNIELYNVCIKIYLFRYIEIKCICLRHITQRVHSARPGV